MVEKHYMGGDVWAAFDKDGLHLTKETPEGKPEKVLQSIVLDEVVLGNVLRFIQQGKEE